MRGTFAGLLAISFTGFATILVKSVTFVHSHCCLFELPMLNIKFTIDEDSPYILQLIEQIPPQHKSTQKNLNCASIHRTYMN